MRFETQIASSNLIRQLQASGIVAAIRDDGGDIVLVELKTGQQVMIHLIEWPIELPEVRDVIARHSQMKIYTLYTFWADFLLPREGMHYEPDDWMAALLKVHRDRIIGWEVSGRQAFFFPVHFEGAGTRRFIRFGPLLDFRALHGSRVETGFGTWWIADFGEAPKRDDYHISTATLAMHYRVLGLSPGAGEEAVKHAYRALARKFHPDLNSSATATERMMQINVAYERIMQHLKNTQQ